MTETNTDIILNSFREWWLREGHSSRSADSYCSGLRHINKEFFIPICHKDMFDELEIAIAKGTAVDWLTALLGTIGAKIAEIENSPDKKRLQDMRSHLYKFIEYVDEWQNNAAMPSTEEYYEYPETTPELYNFNFGPVSNHPFFDHDDLVKILSRHIKFMDCINGDKDVFFPIRILSILFSEATRKHQGRLKKMGIVRFDGKPLNFRKWFAAWIRHVVENVIFHTTKGDYRLSEIEGLKIELSTKSAWIVDKKDKRTIPLLSESPSGMVRMKLDALCKIQLAYSERMEDMLTRLEPALVVMRMLTDNIKASVKGQTLTIKGPDGKSKEIALDSYRFPNNLRVWYCKQVDWDFIVPLLPHLCTELQYIAVATRLTAMSTANNINKH